MLNPGTVRLVPGAIIPKAAGSAGLTPLAAPGKFDVSQLVLQDLRRAHPARAAGGPAGAGDGRRG